MVNEIVLKNVQIVFVDEIVFGFILICDGKIVVIDQGNINGGDDMDGDYVILGFIELYIDQLESYYVLCLKVCWNVDVVVQVYDVQVVVLGIMIVFDVMCVGFDYDCDFVGKDMWMFVDVIDSGVCENCLCVDYFLYLCCEVFLVDCFEIFEFFVVDDCVKFVLLMDYVLGQC